MLRRAPPDWDAMVSSTVMLGGMVVDLKRKDDSKRWSEHEGEEDGVESARTK